MDIREARYDNCDAIWYDGSVGWSRYSNYFGGGDSDDSQNKEPILPWNYGGPGNKYDIQATKEFDKRLVDARKIKPTIGGHQGVRREHGLEGLRLGDVAALAPQVRQRGLVPRS